MQIVVNCETRLCSQFLGPGDHFLQSYGAIFTDRAATGSGNLKSSMSTAVPWCTLTAVPTGEGINQVGVQKFRVLESVEESLKSKAQHNLPVESTFSMGLFECFQ